jgi:thioredoxin reductase (NADPH)
LQNSKQAVKKIKLVSYDVIIIGAGPAGLTSSLYAARSGARTLVLEHENIGGQMTQSPQIKNYPGFTEISGEELSRLMHEQTLQSGAVIDEFADITSVDLRRQIVVSGDNYYRAKAIVIATGVKQMPLDVPGAKEFAGRGVHSCALCDAHLYKEKSVAVVGGGSSALTEALYLSRIAKDVTIIRRKDYFKADKVLLDEVEKTTNIKILYNTDIKAVIGKDTLEKLLLHGADGTFELNVSGVFVYIGGVPQTSLFERYIKSDGLQTDGYGYIITDEHMETAIKDVYAVGDVRSKDIRQIATAVGDGATAGSHILSYKGIKP